MTTEQLEITEIMEQVLYERRIWKTIDRESQKDVTEILAKLIGKSILQTNNQNQGDNDDT